MRIVLLWKGCLITRSHDLIIFIMQILYPENGPYVDIATGNVESKDKALYS